MSKKIRKSVHTQDVLILESAKCREIVREIMDFGVSQQQILTLIKLLSLELENSAVMKDIIEIVDAECNRDSIDKTTTIII